MDPVSAIDTIQQTIRVAVTPVFLLLGIASLISVLSGRLGRVIDRSRALEARCATEKNGDYIRAEAHCLRRRMHLTNWAIRLFVSAALAVCLVVMTLFLGDLLGINTVYLIAALFILTMLLLIGGLLLFLGEVSIASGRVSLPIAGKFGAN